MYALRLIQKHKLRMFPLEGSLRTQPRRTLGSGASNSVQEAKSPVMEALKHARYQQVYASRWLREKRFNDHSGSPWALETLVAHKFPRPSLSEDQDTFLCRTLDDFLRDLRVLCHRPLTNHPNIVQLLGVAWVSDPSIRPGSRKAEPLDWPIILTEIAPHGSLDQFLASRTSRLSLQIKLRICLDVLHALVVRLLSFTIGFDGACSYEIGLTCLWHCSWGREM